MVVESETSHQIPLMFINKALPHSQLNVCRGRVRWETWRWQVLFEKSGKFSGRSAGKCIFVFDPRLKCICCFCALHLLMLALSLFFRIPLESTATKARAEEVRSMARRAKKAKKKDGFMKARARAKSQVSIYAVLISRTIIDSLFVHRLSTCACTLSSF